MAAALPRGSTQESLHIFSASRETEHIYKCCTFINYDNGQSPYKYP